MMSATRTLAPSDRDRDQVVRTKIRTKRAWTTAPKPEKVEVKPPVKQRDPKSGGVDAQELRIRLEAYIASAGPHVLNTEREEDYPQVKGLDRRPSSRRSIYSEDQSGGVTSQANENLDSFQFSSTDAKLNAIQSRPTSLLRQYPLQLPEIEIMESGDLFNPHLLGQVEEVEEPPEYPIPKPIFPGADRSQSQSPSAALRRVTPLQDPRKVYKSLQTTNDPSSTPRAQNDKRLEDCRREVAQQRSSAAPNAPYSTQNERRMIDEAFGGDRGSTYSLTSTVASKPMPPSVREKQGRNFSDDRRNSLPWLMGSKKDSGIGSDISAKQESPELEGRLSKMERRGSMSWRLKGKGDRKGGGSGFGVSERPANRKSGLGFLNIFKR